MCIFDHGERILPLQIALKNRVEVPNRRSSKKCTKKRQDDAYIRHHTSKPGHDIKKKILLNFFGDYAGKLSP